MAYNQGLAVGLGVGLPCLIVFLGVMFFYRRTRRMQREEDLNGNDLDVELGENGSFEEFGEALHKPVANTKTASVGGKSPSKSATNPDDTVVAKSSSSADSASNSYSSKTQSSPDRRKQYLPGFSGEPPQSHVPGTPRSHATGRGSSAYDFYDAVIPIMPSDPDNLRPPSIGATDRHSTHSSRGSLLGGDSSSKSLENLAKQLQGPQFFEKLPSRAATTHIKPPGPNRAAFHSSRTSSKNSSVMDLSQPYENGGINDHFVSRAHYDEPSVAHPYRERANGARDNVFVKGMGLENNFDNNITSETNNASAPDVVFK